MSGRYDKLMKTGFLPLLLVVGVVYFYFQVQDKTEPDDTGKMVPYSFTLKLTSVVTGLPEEIMVDDLAAIASAQTDMHGCFKTRMSLPMLTETYQIYDTAQPIAGGGGLACYNAESINAALAADTAFAFLGQANIADGLDRVVVIYDDGQGFVWNQPNSGQ